MKVINQCIFVRVAKTTLANFEVNQGYKDITDLGVCG